MNDLAEDVLAATDWALLGGQNGWSLHAEERLASLLASPGLVGVLPAGEVEFCRDVDALHERAFVRGR